jgi:hypothetical protein
MKTFEAIAQAILDDDKENGHVGADQQWGKYESNARAALEALKDRLAGTVCEPAIDAILKGET